MKRAINYCNHILRRLTNNKRNPLLPEILFLIGTYFFPQVNVELVIIVDKKLLLTWRDDDFGNVGWHLPGGIIRPNETIQQRIDQVLKYEAKISKSNDCAVEYLELREIFSKIKPAIRSHFISLVYLVQCDKENAQIDNLESHIKYFDQIPENLIENHKVYADLMQSYMR